MQTEYIIWGIAPGGDTEDLLVSEQAGIKSREQAERVKAELESKHGCRKCRIWEYSGEGPDFIGAILS